MAIDKMKMLTVVAPRVHLHGVIEDLVLSGCAHIENHTKQPTNDSLTMSYLESQLDEGFELGTLRHLRYEKTNFKEIYDKLERINENIDASTHLDYGIDHNFRYLEVKSRIETIFEEVTPLKNEVRALLEQKEEKQIFLESMAFLQDAPDIDLAQIRDMTHINYHIGTLSNEGRIKLRDNYENIAALVLHIGSSGGRESYLIFNPPLHEEETMRILKSLNFKEIRFPENLSGSLRDARCTLEAELAELDNRIEAQEEDIRSRCTAYREELDALYTMTRVEEKIEQMLDNVAVTDHFFVFSAWVAESALSALKAELEAEFSALILVEKEVKEVSDNLIPPTKLKNNRLTRPFEALVNMYGIPNYNELDPTLFLGITYIILFGAMFGDVGQGLVLLLGGLWMSKRVKDPELQTYGQILTRLGCSSMVFGFLFGSVFGNEHLLPALFVRPLENINFVLAIAVAFGIVLLLISFGMSIVNLARERDGEELIFGRNGAFGLVFYIALLVTVGQSFAKLSILPNAVLYGAIAAAMIGMLFKKPIYGMLTHQKPHYEEGVGSYFVEGGFDLIETVLSLLSNSISFIRIGAFALNHVGLFMAFATMAKIANQPALGFLILLLGNVIIIGLEGLIVLIQGLRLEYYELFSKYFRGDGNSYAPIRLVGEMEE